MCNLSTEEEPSDSSNDNDYDGEDVPSIESMSKESSMSSSSITGDDDNEQLRPITNNNLFVPFDMGGRSRRLSARMCELISYFKKTVLFLDENDSSNDDSAKVSRRRRRLVAAGTTITACAILLWLRRRHRRDKQKIQSEHGSAIRNEKGLIFFMLSSSFALLKSSSGGNNNRRDSNDYRRATEAPLSLLLNAAKEGSIKRALFTASQSTVLYQLKSDNTATSNVWKRSTLPTKNPAIQQSILDTLTKNGAEFSALPESIISRLTTPIMAALPFIYLALLYKMLKHLHSGGHDTARTYDENSTQQVTFADVAGIDEAVSEVKEVVAYLSNPLSYHGLGARPPRGILLHGPPGSGKTLLARAVAGEAHCEVFVACSGSDFVEQYVGRGAARIRSLFDEAKAQAITKSKGGSTYEQIMQYFLSTVYFASSEQQGQRRKQLRNKNRQPAVVVFMDEIDALAKSRMSLGGNDERDQTLNQLLTEMEGFATNDNRNDVTLIFIAATNRADVLDPAILRRFDRQVYVGYPDENGRKGILSIHARRINHDENIDLDAIACLTNGFSGADLRNVINDSALLAVREKRSVVVQRHLKEATQRIRQMKIGLELAGGPASSR